MSSSLSHEQLSMYMTPEEIKGKGVFGGEMQEEDNASEEHFWNRKKEESYAWNNHGINDESHDLVSDIQKHGVKEPVTFNLDLNKLTDGHHRVASAKPNSLIPVEYEGHDH